MWLDTEPQVENNTPTTTSAVVVEVSDAVLVPRTLDVTWVPPPSPGNLCDPFILSVLNCPDGVAPLMSYVMLSSHRKFLKFEGHYSFFLSGPPVVQCWTSQASPLIFLILSISRLFIFLICFQGEL